MSIAGAFQSPTNSENAETTNLPEQLKSQNTIATSGSSGRERCRLPGGGRGVSKPSRRGAEPMPRRPQAFDDASKRLRSAARQLNDLDPEAHDVTPKVWLILTCNYKLWNWNDSRVLPIKIRLNSISNFVIEASQGLDCLYMNFGIASEMSTYLAWFESQMRIAIGIISATGELEITVGA